MSAVNIRNFRGSRGPGPLKLTSIFLSGIISVVIVVDINFNDLESYPTMDGQPGRYTVDLREMEHDNVVLNIDMNSDSSEKTRDVYR